jgi:Domain of unknown function (DUF4160)
VGKLRRGGYIFVTWKGDHGPRHVHVFKDGKLIGKWDLDNRQVMEGKISRKIQAYIAELSREGRL